MFYWPPVDILVRGYPELSLCRPLEFLLSFCHIVGERARRDPRQRSSGQVSGEGKLRGEGESSHHTRRHQSDDPGESGETPSKGGVRQGQTQMGQPGARSLHLVPFEQRTPTQVGPQDPKNPRPRLDCPECGEEETGEHIVFECPGHQERRKLGEIREWKDLDKPR